MLLYKYVVRLTAMAVLTLVFGAANSVLATTIPPSSPTIAMQDIGDSDDDGIPDFLDPDDNNDGITDDEDTSPEAPETDDGQQEDQGTNEEPAAPVQQGQPPAPQQVSGLPETGTGIDKSSFSAAAFVITGGVISLMCLAAVTIRLSSRMP